MTNREFAAATCDEHLLKSLAHVMGEAPISADRYQIRYFSTPDDHFFCWCKKPATYFIRKIHDDEVTTGPTPKNWIMEIRRDTSADGAFEEIEYDESDDANRLIDGRRE